MLKAVIFDVDGTLLDTEKIYITAWRQAAERFGYTLPQEALRQTRAVSIPVAKERFRYYCGEAFPYDAVRVTRIEIAEEIIRTVPLEQLCKPGAAELLQWLKAQGIALAAATSTGKQQTLDHLERAELLQYFDAVVCGDMIARGKPEPDIFLKAAELMGIAPEDCLVVGDTPADVLAAAAAGMKMVLIPDQVPANEKILASSWKCLESLYQLQSLLSTEQIG